MNRKYPDKPSQAVQRAAEMPILRHSVAEPFDITKSEVVIWLAQQPQILRAMFDFYRDRGAIVFDKEAGNWHGRNFESEKFLQGR